MKKHVIKGVLINVLIVSIVGFFISLNYMSSLQEISSTSVNNYIKSVDSSKNYAYICPHPLDGPYACSFGGFLERIVMVWVAVIMLAYIPAGQYALYTLLNYLLLVGIIFWISRNKHSITTK